jgi:hypothetical protein
MKKMCASQLPAVGSSDWLDGWLEYISREGAGETGNAAHYEQR